MFFFPQYFGERCYIGIRTPRSCTLVLWVLLLLYLAFVFQVGEIIIINLQRKGTSWLLPKVYGVEFYLI